MVNEPSVFESSIPLPSFKSSGILVQAKKTELDFQDGGFGGHLGFPIKIILAIFDLHVTLILPLKFQVNRYFGSGEGSKYIFKMSKPSCTSYPNNFSYV